MKNKFVTFCVAGTILFTTLQSPITANAEKSLKEIRDERQEIKEELSGVEKQISVIMVEIKEINLEIDSLNETLEQNEKVMQEVQQEMEQVQQEIDELEAKIEERFQILSDRAKSYQATGGNITYLEVILGSKNFQDFIGRVQAITKITDSDAALIEEQQSDKEKVEEKLVELQDLEAELIDMNELVNEQRDIALELKKEHEKKNKQLKKLVKKLKIEDKKLAKMEADIFADTQSVSASMITGNGVLAWPTVGGYISSYVGQRWGRAHNGIDIARTNRSTSPPILAAETGVVEVAGFHQGGYGNRIIINHGNGLKTMYAHLASIEVSAGQKINRGDRIGVMGTTGSSTGIHLHFEVHENGSIKNPVAYLR